jgi:tRNA (guanine37-N1)-methyltransferase
MRFDVLTLFPEMFQGYLTQSLLKVAIQKGLVEIHLWNIRDWAQGKHKSVDDRPFGGGPGMVMMAEPVFAAVEAVQQEAAEAGLLVLLTPAGERLTQPVVQELATHRRILLVCGRYEGFDERILEHLASDVISIGRYVLSGGELAAMVICDAVLRKLPGALGHADSAGEESFSAALGGDPEYPHYTRPAEYRGWAVPAVLLSGHHERIAAWRRERSRERGGRERS